MYGSHSAEAPSSSDISIHCSVFFCSRDYSPSQPRATQDGRDNGYFALHPKSNLAPDNVVDKYLLNKISFRSNSQALFYFHRREGERKKRGKQDLLKQPKCKDLMGNLTGDGPLSTFLQFCLA